MVGLDQILEYLHFHAINLCLRLVVPKPDDLESASVQVRRPVCVVLTGVAVLTVV